MFSSYIHWEGTVYAITEKYHFSLFHIIYTHSFGQELGRFWKPALQLIKYVHIDPITAFCMQVILEAVFSS